MIEGQEETMQAESVSAEDYLLDVLLESKSLAESAIRLAAAQSNWRALEIAIAARSSAESLQRWLQDNER